MKFIAILKDSLRETLDVKLFYVMVGLSLLTVLLAASVTFQPVEVEDTLNFNLKFVNQLIKGQAGLDGVDVRFEIENFKRLDDRKEPWLGDYEFDYVVRITTNEGDAEAGANEKRRPGRGGRMRENLKKGIRTSELKRQFATMFREVEVTEKKPSDDLPENTEEFGFHVVGKGTKIKSRQEWYHEPALFFGLVKIPIPMFQMSQIISFIVTWIIGTFGAAFTMILSIVLTASFLPNMLAKGTIDMLIVKPIHRVTLFTYKFMGGLLFMFLNTSVIMIGLYLAIGFRTGTWLNSLLLLILVYTLQFAIFYSVSALMAVLTRSAIVCILMSFLTWCVLFAIGWAQWGFIENRREGAPNEASLETRQHWAFVTFDVVSRLTPRYKEIDWLGNKLLEEELIQLPSEPPPDPNDKEAVAEYEFKQKRAKELLEEQEKALEKKYGSYNWQSSLITTGAFIVAMLGLSCLLFSRKDY